MSSIAERIKFKLEALEKYNFDEQADQESNYSEVREESVLEVELLNLENLEKDSSFTQKETEEMFQKYLSEKDSLNSNKQYFFEVEKMKMENNLNYKYNDDKYFNGRIDGNSLKFLLKKNEEAYLNQASEKNFKFQSNQFKSYSNSQSNYSTDFTKNFESNKKTQNHNYCELEDFAKENIFNCDEEEYFEKSDMYLNIDNSKCESSFNKKTFESIRSVSSKRYSESKASENQMNLREILNYGSNDNPHSYNNEINPHKTFSENSNEELNSNKNSDDENFFYNRISDGNNSDALKTTTQSKNSEASEPIRFFVFFSFIEELLFVFMMIFLLILDPIIILILKIADWVIQKINMIKGSNKYFLLDKNKTNTNFCNHLLICGEIEEVDFKHNFDHFENKIFFSLYEKYFDYFFNNCGYKKLRKTIKICFISISLFLNLIIIRSFVEKNSKILLFFLNNLYLLYHTMDIYNENLLGYSESVRWSNILEKI